MVPWYIGCISRDQLVSTGTNLCQQVAALGDTWKVCKARSTCELRDCGLHIWLCTKKQLELRPSMGPGRGPHKLDLDP